MTPNDTALALVAAGLDPAEHDYEWLAEDVNDLATLTDCDRYEDCVALWLTSPAANWQTARAMTAAVVARRHELSS